MLWIFWRSIIQVTVLRTKVIQWFWRFQTYFCPYCEQIYEGSSNIYETLRITPRDKGTPLIVPRVRLVSVSIALSYQYF